MEKLNVYIPSSLSSAIPEQALKALIGTLQCDPRPRYQHDPGRIYGMEFHGYEVKFSVDENALTVTDIEKTDKK